MLAALTAVLALVAVMLPGVPVAADDHAETTGTFTIRVLNSISGTPVQGADVHIESEVDGQPYDEGTVVTDGDGEATFDGISLEGGLDVTVTGDGFHDYPTTLTAFAVNDGGSQTIQSFTPEGHHLYGTVYDDGQPVSGVTVTADNDSGPLDVTSDAEGHYHFADIDSGIYTVTVDEDGYEPYTADFDIDGTTLRPIHLIDNTPAVGTFVVSDAVTGEPIEGATVQIGGESQDTDADGEAVITIDSTHDTYSLNIDADGYEPYEDADLGELAAGAEFTMARDLDPLPTDVTVYVDSDQTGDPIEGATVDLAGTTAATDQDGVAEFTDVTVADQPMSISEVDGYSPMNTTVTASDIAAGETSRSLFATGTVVGTVTDADTGDPIEGATVDTDHAANTDTTGADGTYTLSGHPTVDTTLYVTADDYETYEQDIDVLAGTNDIPVALDATGDIVEMSGVEVEAGDGEIHLSWNEVSHPDMLGYRIGWDPHAETGAASQFFDETHTEATIGDLVNGEPYEFALRVRMPQFSDVETPETIVIATPQPETDPANFEVEPGDGEAYATWDAPAGDIDGYAIRWASEDEADEGFGSLNDSIADDATTFTIDEYLTNGETYIAQLRSLPDGDWVEADPFTPQAEPTTGTIDGGVFDADGDDPIEGAAVEVDGTTVTTDGDGLYTVEVDAGTHDVAVSADGYDDATETDVEVPAGDTVAVDFSLDAEPTGPTAIDGTVTDADTGEPVDGASVAFSGGSSALLTTGEDGTYNNIGIDATTTTVTVSVHGYEEASETVEVNENETVTVDFELERQRAELTVEVRDNDGDLIEGASASLNGGPFIGDGDGTFATTLEPGTYEIEASADGYESDSQTIEPDWGDVVQVFFALDADEAEPTTGDILINVTDLADQSDIDGATIFLDGDQVATHQGHSTRIEDLEPGTYDVRVEADGYEQLDTREVEVEAGETTHISFDHEAIEDEPESGTLEGTVTDADTGDPIEGAVVTIDGQSDTTGADGVYTIEGVDAGTYEIEVSAEGYADDTAAGIEVDAGESHTHDVGLDADPDVLERACPEDVPESGFVDVVAYADEIDCVVWWDILEGTHTGDQGRHFSPEDAVTRAQVASAIARTITETGGTLPGASSGTFSDVGSGGAHGQNIEQLAAADVIHGYPDGTYRPNETVTRAQVATLLTRAYEHRTGEALADTSTQFPDATTGPHRQSIGQMADQGWAQGYSDGAYRPSHDVRRDHLALMLRRMLGTLVDEHDVVRD